MRKELGKTISVIVPVYNGAKYLDECIRSIANQSYKSLQIIIIDDGSKDDSYSIIKKWEAQDCRIVAFLQENCGVSITRNRGISLATGDFIAFVDQDDLIDVDYFQYLIDLAISNNAEISLVPNVVFYNNGKKEYRERMAPETVEIWTGEDAASEMLYTNIEIGPWNKIVSREIIQKNNIKFHEELFGGEGLAYSIECFLAANQIAVGYKGVYYYRIDNASSGMAKFRPEIVESSIKAQKIIYYSLDRSNKRLMKAWTYAEWKVYLVMLSIMYGCKETSKYPEMYKELLRNTRRGILIVPFAPLSLKRKLIELRFCIIPRVIGKRCENYAQRDYEKNIQEGD